MDGSLPNLRRQLAGLFTGAIALDQFQAWYWANAATIEQRGSDEDVALLNLVMNRLAEYTSDYIDASELLDALRTDPLVQKELLTRRTAAA
jgi:hypothetical protein